MTKTCQMIRIVQGGLLEARKVTGDDFNCLCLQKLPGLIICLIHIPAEAPGCRGGLNVQRKVLQTSGGIFLKEH